MATTDSTTSLARAVTDMIVAEVPGIAWVGPHLALITMDRDDHDDTQLLITVRPVDFTAIDSVRVVASLRIDSITREPATTGMLTAAADV